MQEQRIVYKIAKVIAPNDPESTIISIYVQAKEGESDDLGFTWDYNRQTPNIWRSTDIALHLNTYNLNYLLDMMKEEGINTHSQPEEVLGFLEKNGILQAIGIQLQLPGQQRNRTFLITENEIEAGAIQTNGQTYTISIELEAKLKKLKEQRSIPPPAFQ